MFVNPCKNVPDSDIIIICIPSCNIKQIDEIEYICYKNYKCLPLDNSKIVYKLRF